MRRWPVVGLVVVNGFLVAVGCGSSHPPAGEEEGTPQSSTNGGGGGGGVSIAILVDGSPDGAACSCVKDGITIPCGWSICTADHSYACVANGQISVDVGCDADADAAPN